MIYCAGTIKIARKGAGADGGQLRKKNQKNEVIWKESTSGGHATQTKRKEGNDE